MSGWRDEADPEAVSEARVLADHGHHDLAVTLLAAEQRRVLAGRRGRVLARIEVEPGFLHCPCCWATSQAESHSFCTRCIGMWPYADAAVRAILDGVPDA